MVVIQCDLKFTSHIYTKISKTKQQLGMVKCTLLFEASEKAKLLAYIGLCRPHVEYAAVWDPNMEYIAPDVEMVQHNAVRFISGLKIRDSITSALENLAVSVFWHEY